MNTYEITQHNDRILDNTA